MLFWKILERYHNKLTKIYSSMLTTENEEKHPEKYVIASKKWAYHRERSIQILNDHILKD